MAITFLPRARTASASAIALDASKADRRYPSPAAQLRAGEQWRVRLGLGFATLLTLCASAAFWHVLPK